MRRDAEATPCPAPPNPSFHSDYANSNYGRRSSIYAPGYGAHDDNTTATNLEYTTEIQHTARMAKPRRPARRARQTPFNPTQDIFEDVAQEEEQQQQAVEVQRKSRASVIPEGVHEKRSTILAHPAQKIHLPPAPAPPVQESQPHTNRPQRRRVSQLLGYRHVETDATTQLREETLEKKELKKQGPRKDPRRRTIYVPSDDTTIMTIHPGQPSQKHRITRQKSPDIGLDLVTVSDEEPENLVPALKQERKKAPRKSLAAPPMRGPLQQSTRPLQGKSFPNDVPGQGGGKENIPPVTHIKLNSGKPNSKRPTSKSTKVHFNTSKTSDVVSRANSKSESSHKRLRSQLSYDGSPAKSIKARADGSASTTSGISTSTRSKSTVKSVKSAASRSRRQPLSSSSPFHTDRSPPNALRRQRTEKAPTKISMMHEVGRPPQPPKEKYPVLSEDLARPELYEDNWLTYQEVAITQLLNSIFESANKNQNVEQGPHELRKRFLNLYHEPAIPNLHKRLQASLQYGALSIPRDLLGQTLRLKDDVGLRKKFLNLWVKTYDLSALRAAAETIIGRQIIVPSRLSSGSTSSDDGSRTFRAERRAIESFLDTFLIRNEDAVRVKSGAGSIASLARGDHHGDDFGSQGWTWRRTVLRSLMLILLLDKAKTSDAIPRCLFQNTSQYKTSVEVLHVLSNILLPSLGDITRPLGHLNYKVEHIQYPLQEYKYHIDNIAIDLRDGVNLTRLVELLLYPSSTLAAHEEDSVTIALPTGDMLTSSIDFSQKESWVLSQHLKFPSIGRPQKLYNVQIALAALTGVRGVPVQAVNGIKAEDIVDGHREKTLSLLWSLVGKFGLGTLVDWPRIAKETERFREMWYSNRDNCEQRDLDSDEGEETAELTGSEYHKRLLLSWSRSIARFYGLRVSNLTTSFANPKVLEAIVDAYLPDTLVSPTSGLNLVAKLKATGCSTSFVSLFANPKSAKSIPSKDFTLLTLSFLASRLLPLSLTHRAASTIQRAYRRHRERGQVHKRVVLMRLAHECAAVAQAREQLINAAVIIQGRWRSILEKRKERLVHDVQLFQALARGWAIRRWVRRITGGKIGGKEKVRRKRGGW